MKDLLLCALLCAGLAGCATAPSMSGKPAEPVGAQIEAARKVVGALSPAPGAVEKYSPVTGKHYSGALEYEPGTGVKLLPVED